MSDSDLNPMSLEGSSFKILTGNAAYTFAVSLSPIKRRFIFDSFYKAAFHVKCNKVIGLYGLRRTGKTTLMLQAIKELYERGIHSVAYIVCLKPTFSGYLYREMEILREHGITIFLVDEVTRLVDFSKSSAFLQDIFVQGGCSVVIAGTDSLCLDAATTDSLLDRMVRIHTTQIPFKEYNYLTGDSLDSFLLHGGLLRKQTPELTGLFDFSDEMSYPDEEDIQRYVDSAIVSNIETTLSRASPYYLSSELRYLVDRHKLTPIIHNMLQTTERGYIPISMVPEKDISSALELYAKHINEIPSCSYITISDVVTAVKQVTYSLQYSEGVEELSNEASKQLLRLLQNMDLIAPFTVVVGGENRILKCKKHWISLTPCLRNSQYAIAEYALNTDPYVVSLPMAEREFLMNKALGDRKGRLLEELVIAETILSLRPQDYYVFQFRLEYLSAEIDMVIYDVKFRMLDLYEVKSSTMVSESQVKWLNNAVILDCLENNFGAVRSKNVLYQGESTNKDGVNYINVTEYLFSLKPRFKATR